MAIAFVTGGTGLLGARLVETLVREGWTVRALHRSTKDAGRLRALGAEPVQGDLGDAASLRGGVAGADVVFHCAALFTMWASAAEYERANVTGTRDLLAVAADARVKMFVQIGAAGVVMGERRPMTGVTEDAPLACPAWAPYLASKARAANLVIQADAPGAMRTTVILPPLIWGPAMPMLDGVVADVAAGRFAWPGGGRQIMSTAHVDNVCHCAILAAARSPGGRAYFVTDGEDRPMREVMTTLLASRGVTVNARDAPIGTAWLLATVMEGAWRTFRLKGHPPLTRQMLRMVGYDFTISDRRARSELGYAPVVSWQEGVAAMRSAVA
jgi:nucleoside-diphosphate-sugar epimerase